MSYPNSSDVIAGQATEAAQYNNLRSDALYLGGDAATSGNMRALLYQYRGPLSLQRNGSAGIVINASEDAPVSMMIGGAIRSVSASQNVTVDSSIYTDVCRLYLFAAADSAGGFTLKIAESAVERSGTRLIGSFLWSGDGIIPGTLRTAAEMEITAAASVPSLNEGRLSYIAGEPVPDSDISLGTTLYFTPCVGNRVSLYLGGAWGTFTFSELSLPVGGLLRMVPYDVFIEAGSAGLALSCSCWGTASARPSGMLSRVDGILVSAADPGKRYLGSFALNSEGYGADSRTERLLWNVTNRAPRPLLSKLMTDAAGVYHTNVWAPYFDDAAPEVTVLIPSADTEFELEGVGIGSVVVSSDLSTTRAFALGIGRDMVKTEPYVDNTTAVPVFTHSRGNAPIRVKIFNTDATFQGLHTYTLAAWSNTAFAPSGTEFRSTAGECPGLIGAVRS